MLYSKILSTGLVCIGIVAVCARDAHAQAGASFPPCIPTAQPTTQPPEPGAAAVGLQPSRGRGPAPQRIPRDAPVTAIPGVVAAGSQWTKIWQAGGNSADGILAAPDGSVLVAQEDFDTVLRIDADGQTSVVVAGAKGVGSLSMDRQGRLYGAHRT